MRRLAMHAIAFDDTAEIVRAIGERELELDMLGGHLCRRNGNTHSIGGRGALHSLKMLIECELECVR